MLYGFYFDGHTFKAFAKVAPSRQLEDHVVEVTDEFHGSEILKDIKHVVFYGAVKKGSALEHFQKHFRATFTFPT